MTTTEDGQSVIIYSLWRIRHRQADTITAGHGEEHHDDNKQPVVVKEHGQVVAFLDVTEHQQRDEDHTGDH